MSQSDPTRNPFKNDMFDLQIRLTRPDPPILLRLVLGMQPGMQETNFALKNSAAPGKYFQRGYWFFAGVSTPKCSTGSRGIKGVGVLTSFPRLWWCCFLASAISICLYCNAFVASVAHGKACVVQQFLNINKNFYLFSKKKKSLFFIYLFFIIMLLAIRPLYVFSYKFSNSNTSV